MKQHQLSRRGLLAGLGATTALAALAACVSTGTSAPNRERLDSLQLLIPTAPGGGFDVTARVAARAMQDAQIITAAEITNLPGAAGIAGLGRTIAEAGNPGLLLMMGLGMVGAVHASGGGIGLDQTTPIARLVEESAAIIVAANSPFQSIDELLEVWRRAPDALPIGGGSSVGGPDHLMAMTLADTVGIDPLDVSFRSFSGGGELLPALLRGEIAFAASGYPEFLVQVESGDLRMLATTGDDASRIVDAPTFRDRGIDFEFTNWRGFVAAPGLLDDDRERLSRVVADLVNSTQWRDAIVQNGWRDAYLAGSPFGDFLRAQHASVGQTLSDLGFT